MNLKFGSLVQISKHPSAIVYKVVRIDTYGNVFGRHNVLNFGEEFLGHLNEMHVVEK